MLTPNLGSPHNPIPHLQHHQLQLWLFHPAPTCFCFLGKTPFISFFPSWVNFSLFSLLPYACMLSRKQRGILGHLEQVFFSFSTRLTLLEQKINRLSPTEPIERKSTHAVITGAEPTTSTKMSLNLLFLWNQKIISRFKTSWETLPLPLPGIILLVGPVAGLQGQRNPSWDIHSDEDSFLKLIPVGF